MLRDPSLPTAAPEFDAANGSRRHRPAPSPMQIDDRAALARAVERQLARCRRSGDSLALLVITPAVAPPPALAGRLLELVELRLRAGVRSNDTVMRIGSEHFGVLLFDAGEIRVRVVRARLGRVLRGPYVLDGLALEFSPAQGHAVYPHAATDSQGLIHAAWPPGPLHDDESDRDGRLGEGPRSGAT